MAARETRLPDRLHDARVVPLKLADAVSVEEYRMPQAALMG